MNNVSLKDQIEEIIILIKDFKDDSLVKDFINSWKDDLSLIKQKIEKEKLSNSDINEIKQISYEIINSLILKWVIPHQKLEKLLNILTLKNNLLNKIKDRHVSLSTVGGKLDQQNNRQKDS